jgi:hypothetical protein
MTSIVRGGVAVAVLLLLAGCGGGDTQSSGASSSSGLSADEQTVADNLAAQMVRSGQVSGESSAQDAVTPDQATCVAEGAVAKIGVPSLQDYGIVTEDLKVNKEIQGVAMSREDADALADVFVGCIEAEKLFEKTFLAALPGTPDQEVQDCVRKAVDTGSVTAVLSARFQGRTAGVYDRLQERVSACAGRRDPGQ